MKTEILSKANSEVKIRVTIDPQTVKTEIEKITAEALKNVEVPGFRKGKAPADKAEERLDRSQINGRVINTLLPQSYTQAIKEHNIKPISDPKVEVTTFSENEGLVYTVTIAEMPKINLKNYEENIKNIKPQKPEEGKEKSARDSTRTQIIQTLINTTEAQIPNLLIEQEVNRMFSRLVSQLDRLNLSVENYLKSENKTKEDLEKEYRKVAESNIKAELVLGEIGKQKGVTVEDTDIQSAIDASPDENTKKELAKEHNKWYIRGVIFRTKTLDKLEELTQNEEPANTNSR